MGLHAAVRVLHHGVDGALRLHDHADAIVGHGEQVVRLDDLETLVHQRGRVDGYLRAHVPRGVRERLSGRDIGQVGSRAAAERSARRRHPQARHLARVFAQKALVDGAVLGIDGHEAPRLGGHRHDEVAAHHERLLVRERQHLVSCERLVAGAQAGRAHQRVHHDVGLGQAHEAHHGVGTEPERPFAARVVTRHGLGQRRRRARWLLRASVRSAQDGVSQLVGNRLLSQALVAHREVAHAELARLRQQLARARAHGEAHHLQLVRMATHNVQRLRADGARGAQDHYAFHARLLETGRT